MLLISKGEEMSFEDWDISDTIEGELTNNLILVDNIVKDIGCSPTPEFHILGGAALIFNGVNYETTIDIDTANRINDQIKENISSFINDMASEVVDLPVRYRDRLIPFKPSIFDAIQVYCLSNEDLVYTKLSASRSKDMTQLKKTDILYKTDILALRSIIKEESSSEELRIRVEERLGLLME